MSCNDEAFVEREAEIEAGPDEVWDELGALLDDEGRLRVDEVVEPPHRLSFWWAPTGGDDAPSHVDIRLEPYGLGTLIHIREERLDGAALSRAAFHASANYARARA
jgi:hypothetical protein